MGLFFGNYDKAGPGVPKDAPKKSRIVVFFEILSRKFWKLIQLNFLYLLFCIPIVTIAPATAALTKVLRNFSQEKHSFIWSDFIEAFRKNFKQSFVVGIVDIIIILGLFFGFQVYPSMATTNWFFYVPLMFSIAVMITVFFMHFYIFLMIVTLDLPLIGIIKNSFILVTLGMKTNFLTLLAMAVTILVPFLLAFFVDVSFLLLIPILCSSIIILIICYNCFPIIEKFVIKPYYDSLEESEEPQEPVAAIDTICEDKGGTELPIKGTSNRVKKNKIS